MRPPISLSFLLVFISCSCWGQIYFGALSGVATLSADAGSQRTAQGLALSSYAPANGGALNLLAGVHLHDYFSVQADYIWNRNDLVVNSSSSSGSFYTESRSSSQNAGVFDFLVYFRQRHSRIRPYLSEGVGIAHLSSVRERLAATGGSPALSPARFSSTNVVLRSHVGIDVKLTPKLGFRYSFSETLGHDEISRQLSPPATHKLMNFQNLFGFLVHF